MPLLTGSLCRVPAAVLAVFLLAAAGDRSRGDADTLASPESPAISFTTATLGFDRRYLVLGWVFSTNAAVVVDALGYYDFKGSGLRAKHTVGIFDSDGTLLATAVVPAGSKAPRIGSFRYTAIPPMTLAAGEAYTIAATADTYLNPNGYDVWGRDVTALTPDPAIAIPAGAGRFEPEKQDGLVDPVTAGGTNLYAGPNFLIAGGSAAAPQPGKSTSDTRQRHRFIAASSSSPPARPGRPSSSLWASASLPWTRSVSARSAWAGK